MAITFAYTESTNTVVVTEGTSGTPATFADFVTADRAGTGTDLLLAIAGAALAAPAAIGAPRPTIATIRTSSLRVVWPKTYCHHPLLCRMESVAHHRAYLPSKQVKTFGHRMT